MLLALALAIQNPAQNFAPTSRPGADPLFVASLHATCPSSHPDDVPALMKEELAQAASADNSKNAGRWTTLACTRALLALDGAISHSGPLMLPGASWKSGAIEAFIEALSYRADEHRAANGLALFAMNESDPRGMANEAKVLDRAASAGAVDAPTLRACSELSIRAGQPAAARRCSQQALLLGRDSTEHLLTLARLAFRDADTVSGVKDFLAAAGAARDSASRLAMAWHLQWFVSPGEDAAWRKLDPSGQANWVRDHLAMRDIRDARPNGARLAEQFKRFDHVDSSFRMHVPPKVANSMRTSASADTKFDEGEFRDYRRWQVDIDDKGVVWMRFGAPMKYGFAEDTEVWYYEVDGKPLLLTFVYERFSGSSRPSRLVTGHISAGRGGEVYCGLDTWRCLLAMRPVIQPEIREQVREQDREFVAVATTNDDNSVHTDKTIELISRLHRLWDPVSGIPVALVTYALKASDLVTPKDSTQQTARVEFDLRRWDAAADRWQDTAFTRRFNFAGKGVRRLTGFVVTPSSPTVSSWSLVATQSTDRRGRAWDVNTGPLDSGPIALSDLVLGQQETGGLVWNYHNVEVPLAPLNAVDRLLPVSLYYQIRSEAAHQNMHTTVALYRTDGRVSSDSAALQVGFEQSVRAGINEVAPALDVSRLEKGRYRLEVRLADERGVVVTRREVQLNLE